MVVKYHKPEARGRKKRRGGKNKVAVLRENVVLETRKEKQSLGKPFNKFVAAEGALHGCKKKMIPA